MRLPQVGQRATGEAQPSRSGALRLMLLAGAALSLALLLAPAASHAQSRPTVALTAGGGEVWSADLTVGNNRGLVGYLTRPTHTTGDLTSATFSWRGRTYTIENLVSNQTRGRGDSWDILLDVSPPLIEDVPCLTLRLGDRWLNLADGMGDGRQFFWYGIELPWRFRDEVSVGIWEFMPAFEPRSMDGWGNNPREPELGMANRVLERRAGVSLAYGLTAGPPRACRSRACSATWSRRSPARCPTQSGPPTWCGSGASSWTTTSA